MVLHIYAFPMKILKGFSIYYLVFSIKLGPNSHWFTTTCQCLVYCRFFCQAKEKTICKSICIIYGRNIKTFFTQYVVLCHESFSGNKTLTIGMICSKSHLIIKIMRKLKNSDDSANKHWVQLSYLYQLVAKIFMMS